MELPKFNLDMFIRACELYVIELTRALDEGELDDYEAFVAAGQIREYTYILERRDQWN